MITIATSGHHVLLGYHKIDDVGGWPENLTLTWSSLML